MACLPVIKLNKGSCFYCALFDGTQKQFQKVTCLWKSIEMHGRFQTNA